MRLLIAILFPITVLMVILTIIGIFNVQLGRYIVPIGACIFVLILLSIIAYIIDYPHFYIYAVSIGFGILFAELLRSIIGTPLDNIIGFGISGIIILTYGLITLIKFIQKYPIPKEENIDA